MAGVDETKLIIFAGLPGTGKTTIARELTRQLDAVYLRIDSIEQAIRNSRRESLPVEDEGYRETYALAEKHLRLGRVVIADSVNPLAITRDAWAAVATRSKVGALEIEFLCSDAAQHRKIVELRSPDIPGLELPSWEAVLSREYDPWTRDHLVIDTAIRTPDECIQMIQETLAERISRSQ